ncbi:MAG TPA: hypothetical protein VGO47_10720 [Chlamydiales bacterium]|nr:hypothetical protein [Chlamydiales bacterium]
MKLEIHLEASRNYNQTAEELVASLQAVPRPLNQKPGPPDPNIHSVQTFRPEDIIGEIGFGWTDFTGNVVAKAFEEKGEMYGLFGEDWLKLTRLAEGLQRKIIPQGVVSSKRLSELIFVWVQHKYRQTSILTMTDYVLSECAKEIEEFEIWIPISHLYIQSPFVFGKIEFRAITKAMIDGWEQSLLSKTTTVEEADSVRKGIERRRPKIQGLATATFKVTAEPERAFEISFEETEKTMSILRLLSPANSHPAKICYSAPLGRQHEDSDTYLFFEKGKILGYNSGFVDKSVTQWNLSNQDLATWLPELNILSGLLRQEQRTDLQGSLLDALVLYSRSSLAKQVSDKLVYILIALESVFLRNRGELIQDAISWRMAYMQDVSVEKRREIIANVKTIYKLRSSFIHHGQIVGVNETKILTDFMMNGLLSLAALIPLAATQITKEEFFSNLENRRLAG